MGKRIVLPGAKNPDGESVRIKVFVDEQKYSGETEMDGKDLECYHVVLYDRGNPVGTGRLFLGDDGETYHLGRIAVLKEYRGTGLGLAVVKAMEEEIVKLGGEKAFLSAQDHAVGFYEKLGFKVSGEMYMDEHTPHYPMTKTLIVTKKQ